MGKGMREDLLHQAMTPVIELLVPVVGKKGVIVVPTAMMKRRVAFNQNKCSFSLGAINHQERKDLHSSVGHSSSFP